MDPISTLFAQIEAQNKRLDNYITSNMYVQNIICDYYEKEHAYSKCPVNNWFYPYFEQTNFVGDF